MQKTRADAKSATAAESERENGKQSDPEKRDRCCQNKIKIKKEDDGGWKGV